MTKWLLCSRCGQLVSMCRCLPPLGEKWTWPDRVDVDDADPNSAFEYFDPPIKLDLSKKDSKKEPLFPILECIKCGKFLCECYKQDLHR